MDEVVDEIGAFEAKTRLSELLRQTERGRSFVILRRGKAVARLVPPGHESAAAGRRAASVMIRPAATSGSLLANATTQPLRMAASMGWRAARPAMATTTMSGLSLIHI